MTYLDLRKAFHDTAQDADQLYDRRFNDERTWHLKTSIAGSPAFVYMAPEIYEALLDAAQIDKDILRLEAALPQRALDSYRESCLIDEIVLTNEIEGVHSTRREIGEVLERLKQNDRRGRFFGIVQKYALLQTRPDIALRTCADVRDVYDDLVLAEVRISDPHNVPDGTYFRTKMVHVINEAGIPIHDGIEPEARIIEEMDQALDVLNDESREPLLRIALFHFLFGYIHPFYDGNGRTNRFISSYLISRQYEPIVGLGISHAVKQEIEKICGQKSFEMQEADENLVQYYNMIQEICRLIFVMLLSVLGVSTIIMLISDIKLRETEILEWKTMGYRKRDIMYMLVMEHLVLVIKAFLTAIIVSVVFVFAVNYVIQNCLPFYRRTIVIQWQGNTLWMIGAILIVSAVIAIIVAGYGIAYGKEAERKYL